MRRSTLVGTKLALQCMTFTDNSTFLTLPRLASSSSLACFLTSESLLGSMALHDRLCYRPSRYVRSTPIYFGFSILFVSLWVQTLWLLEMWRPFPGHGLRGRQLDCAFSFSPPRAIVRLMEPFDQYVALVDLRVPSIFVLSFYYASDVSGWAN